MGNYHTLISTHSPKREQTFSATRTFFLLIWHRAPALLLIFSEMYKRLWNESKRVPVPSLSPSADILHWSLSYCCHNLSLFLQKVGRCWEALAARSDGTAKIILELAHRERELFLSGPLRWCMMLTMAWDCLWKVWCRLENLTSRSCQLLHCISEDKFCFMLMRYRILSSQYSLSVLLEHVSMFNQIVFFCFLIKLYFLIFFLVF